MSFWKTVILASIPVLIEYYAEEYRKEDLRNTFLVNSSSYYLPQVESYDFIVVGAGAAGCILASRLSENPSVKVLLLEFGGNPPPQTEIPAYYFSKNEYANVRSILYVYETVPQKHANNSVLIALQAKLMGGSGSINGMDFNRGNPRDFDKWVKITNDPSWSYDNVLQYFKRIENYHGEFTVQPHHGTNGLITVSKQDYAPGRSEWFSAGREINYQTRDPNGPQMTSFTPVEYNKRNGRRHSSYLAYIKPIEKERRNLKIIRYAEVLEVLLGENNKAYGVMFKRHGTFGAAFATNEIIVSAGTYGTTQLLMKSGIGPKEILSQAKIPVKMDLPVGKNYKNHPVLRLQFFTDDRSLVLDPDTDYNQTVIDDFEKNGTGPLTGRLGKTGQAFLPSSVAVAANEKDWPDIQLQLSSGNAYVSNANDSGFPLQHSIFLTRPKSRGYVSINPNNVTGPPIIDFNFLCDKKDVQVLMDAIKMSLNLYESTNVYKKKVKYTQVPVPACRHLPFRSDPYWECYIRNGVSSGLHPVGTCAMGKNQFDPNAVVDSNLRVIGVTGLRIADASVMPDITNSNTQAPVFMIAEKASEEIKSLWGL